MQHVIIVNMAFPPISGPGVWRVLGLTKYLPDAGRRLTVVCSDRPTWHDFRDPQLLRHVPGSVRVIRLRSLFLQDVLKALADRATRSRRRMSRRILEEIAGFLNRYYPDPAILWAARATWTTAKLARGNRDTCVVTSGPQHVAHVAGLFAKRVLHRRWIMDYRDPWSLAPGMVQPGPYQARFWRWVEAACLRYCDAVVTVSESTKAGLVAAFPKELTAGRISVIPNGHDISEESLPAIAPPPRFATLHLHFNGVVQGNSIQAVKQLLGVLARLQRSRGRDEIPVVTMTGFREAIRAEIAEKGLADVVLDVGYLPHSEAVRLCVDADALLVAVNAPASGEDSTTLGAVPAKVYEALATGKHILAIVPPDGDAAGVLREYPRVTFADPNDADDLTRAVLALEELRRSDPERLRKPLKPMSPVAVRFARRILTREYGALIDTVSVSAGPAR